MKRRSFLSNSAIFLGGLPVSTISSNLILPKTTILKNSTLETPPPNIPMYIYGLQNCSGGSILSRAGQILENRFFSSWVIDNAYQQASYSYLKGGYWKDCNMHRQSSVSKWEFLRWQINTLRGLNWFPKLKIKGYNERSNSCGKAHPGKVKIKWISSRYVEITGEFEVFLNKYHLCGGADPEALASLIAHEMLHNLGHIHDKNEYGKHLQINAFECALYYNGNCNSFSPLSNCGCG